MNLADAYSLFQRGAEALAQVEANGIKVDTAYLDRAIHRAAVKIATGQAALQANGLWTAWRKRHGERAKLGSRDQLMAVLRGEGLAPKTGAQTRTGRDKADKAALARVDHPFVRAWQELDELKRAKRTFLEGIRAEVVDGFLHPAFHLHTVESGRGSSSDPNFQNFPIRDPKYGRLIRSAFVPRPGCVLVENDFSAHEFRIAAAVWGDPRMQEYAAVGKDIHRSLAQRCWFLAASEVNKDTRYSAKNGFVFPRLYGSWHAQIAAHMWAMIGEKKLIGPNGIPMLDHLAANGVKELGDCDPQKQPPRPGTFEAHIKKVQDWWDNYFTVFRERSESAVEEYRKRGWFDCATGFRFQGEYSRNQVLNFQIQGQGFHCLLWCLIELLEALRRRRMKALVIGQIHDCILADVPRGELQAYLELVRRIVEVRLLRAWKWLDGVQLGVEAEVAEDNWWGKREWIKREGIWAPK